MNIPNIKNAYENVSNACNKRLKELFPHTVPKDVQKRLDKELKYLKKSNYIDDFEIARLLYKEAEKSSQYLTCRGTITGSLIFYLISNSRVNPLEPYYICPDCGEVKKIKSKLFGIDYPECTCTKCNSIMNSNGYNLSIESVWGLDGKKTISFEYNTSEEFFPFAKRLLEKTFPKNAVEPYGIFYMQDDAPSVNLSMCGYVILSDKQTIDDYPDLIGYLENGDKCISGNIMEITENNMKRILLYNNPINNAIVKMQRCTGIYIDSITTKDLQDINWTTIANTKLLSKETVDLIRANKPKTKTELINLLCASSSDYTCCPRTSHNRTQELIQMLQSEEFSTYPCYSRDDTFELLVTLGIDRKIAYEYSEFIRKGQASRANITSEFDSLDLPEEFRNTAKTIRYLFPRSHCIEYALSYTILAYYLKADSKSYSKMIRLQYTSTI